VPSPAPGPAACTRLGGRYVGPSSGGGIWDESSSAGIGVTEGDPGAVIVSRPRPGWVRLPPSILPAPTVLSSAKK